MAAPRTSTDARWCGYAARDGVSTRLVFIASSLSACRSYSCAASSQRCRPSGNFVIAACMRHSWARPRINFALWHSFMSAKKQFNVETNCRDTGESSDECERGPNDRDQRCRVHAEYRRRLRCVHGAARHRNKPLKIVIRHSITRLGRVRHATHCRRNHPKTSPSGIAWKGTPVDFARICAVASTGAAMLFLLAVTVGLVAP